MTRHALFVAPFDDLADPALLADLAADAEQAGWDGFFLWDHLVYTPPVRAVADPWICLAAMSMSTERLLLGPMVTPLPRRRPVVLARQAIALQRLSRGRLVLGFGIGDDGATKELSGFGEEPDPRVRAAMLDEGLGLLADMFSGERIEHRGEYYTATAPPVGPFPDEPIPIWIAGRWPNRAPLRRAARYDGAFVISIDSADAAADLVAALRELRADLDGYDVVLELAPGADAHEWARIPGVTWLLTRLGPFGLDVGEARRVARAGPPRSDPEAP